MKSHPVQGVLAGLILIGLLAGCVPVSAPATEMPELPTPTTVTPAGDETPSPEPEALETWVTSVSPDGQWYAKSVVAFPSGGGDYYQRLTVTRADEQVTWTPVETWLPWLLGYTVAIPFSWSTQGKALYFTNQPVPDGCAVLVNGGDLQRLDLITGEVIEILPASGLWLALSLAEDRVAVVAYGPSSLAIHDLSEPTQPQVLPLSETGSNTQAGSVIWSPDGTQVALALAHDPCMDGWARATSVMVVDVATLDVVTPVAEDERLLRPVEWATAERIVLQGEDGVRFALNSVTGELTEAE